RAGPGEMPALHLRDLEGTPLDREVRRDLHPAAALAALILALAAALAAALPLPAHAQDEAAAMAAGLQAEVRAGEEADARIATAVSARLLRQPALQRVTVAVNAGVVTLGGEVVADADRKLAGDLAAKVDGVTTVVNDIAIAADLRTRVDAALDQMQGKLVRL